MEDENLTKGEILDALSSFSEEELVNMVRLATLSLEKDWGTEICELSEEGTDVLHEKLHSLAFPGV